MGLGMVMTLCVSHLTTAQGLVVNREPVDMDHDLVFLCFPVRTAIWDAVAEYIQEQLLLRKVGQLFVHDLVQGVGRGWSRGRAHIPNIGHF